MMVLADNQRYAANLLEKAGAVKMLLLGTTLGAQINDFIHEAMGTRESLKKLVGSACKITDGNGCNRVTDWLISGEQK